MDKDGAWRPLPREGGLRVNGTMRNPQPPDRAGAARHALACLDLTSLGEDDGPGDAVALCERAVTRHGSVAAVCLWPRFLPVAREILGRTAVRIGTVANFPEGSAHADLAAAACAEAAAYRADEVDLVFPYTAWFRGDERAAVDLVRICRAALGRRVVFKVILETGAFDDDGDLRSAAEACLGAGANFLKTSTGTRAPGATQQAVRILLEAVRANGAGAGVKVSGGIRTLEQAAVYLDLAAQVCGPAWATPATFRIGASGLLDALLDALDR